MTGAARTRPMTVSHVIRCHRPTAMRSMPMMPGSQHRWKIGEMAKGAHSRSFVLSESGMMSESSRLSKLALNPATGRTAHPASASAPSAGSCGAGSYGYTVAIGSRYQCQQSKPDPTRRLVMNHWRDGSEIHGEGFQVLQKESRGSTRKALCIGVRLGQRVDCADLWRGKTKPTSDDRQ